jgi:putative transferase (TIGR04331 family)
MLLVTSAIEETWGTDEEILFLGEWCKIYDRRHVWQERNYVTLPYNWDDRTQLYADSEYLRDLYEKLLPKLSAKLNEIHGTSHTDRYWRILVGLWLGYFLQILFQRWSSIANATKDFQALNTILLTDKTDCLVPNDMAEFVDLMCGDHWNHYICGRILQYQGKVDCSFLNSNNINGEDGNLPLKRSLGNKHKLKNIPLITWNLCLSPFAKNEDLFFISTYLPLLEELKLNLRFRQVPKFNRSQPVPQVPSIKEGRQWHLDGFSLTKFESFVSEILPSQIPTAYLEGYDCLMAYSDSLPWPKLPKLIFTSNSHVYDDLVKAWIASKVEQGASFVIGQHGGGSFHAINFQTEHELAICDRYLSPGRGNTWHPKVIDAGQLFSRRWKHNAVGGGLLMQLATPRYSYCISSTVQSDDFNKYLNEQMCFIQLLPSNIRKSFTVRLNAVDFLRNDQERWHDRFPDLAIDSGRQNIHSLFSQSRVIVCTYAGTTFNQTIAANAPTVIFWNPKYEQLHRTSEPYFDDLIRVGIFHETPESAAAHISMIWEDVDAWWQSAAVQEVRECYCRSYANLPDNLLDRVETVLRDVIAESEMKKSLVDTRK